MKKLENAFEVVEHTDAMLAFWDIDLICRFANSTYVKWFGLSPADMIDKITLSKLLGPIYQQNLPFIQKALQGKLQIFERDITLPSGEVKNTIATYTPHRRQGKVIGFYAHVADVTILKNQSIKIAEVPDDYLAMSVAHNYLNGVEHSLRSSLFTKFPGIPALAKTYYISVTKLKKDFKLRYRKTIFSYYRSLQMEAAEKYIKGEIYSRKQLAEMFKFENPFNFSSCYEKYLQRNVSVVQITSEPDNHNSDIDFEPASDILQRGYQQLINEHEVLDAIAKHLQIGTWERNFETVLATWSNVTKDILELPLDFEPDMTPALNFYKAGFDRKSAKKHLELAFTSGKSFDFQAQIITAKGNEKRLRVFGFCQFEDNVCRRMYGAFKEVI